MGKPRLTGSRHVLPFRELSPRDFERLCLWLLHEEGFEEVHHIGAAGSDEGCDLSAVRNGQSWVCQCKQVKEFYPKAAEAEIRKILDWPEEERPQNLLFLVTCDVTLETRKRAAEAAAPHRCSFWAATELDRAVKVRGRILDEFFELPAGTPRSDIRSFGYAVAAALDVIDDLIEAENVLDLWVPLAGELEEDGGNKPVGVWKFATGWLERPPGRPLAILGDYGTGKSWLCLRLARWLGDAFRREPQSHPAPLLLSFKSYREGMDLDDLITSALARDYGQDRCDLYRIREGIRSGRIVLILDGLDEMVREIGHRDALVQFARLGVPPAAHVVITCRTHYFVSGSEQREALSPGDNRLLARSDPGFEILHLKLLDPARVEDAIHRRFAAPAQSGVLDFLRSTYNLSELCARPVLLSLVCESYGSLKTIDRAVTVADLYESYLEAWLARELRSGRLQLPRGEVVRFFEDLAETLLRRGSLWLSSADFEGCVAALVGRLGTGNASVGSLARQLTTSTFLRRTPGDGWEFVHRSFQEFLYAKRFFRWERETGGEGDFPVTHVPAWQFISQLVLSEWNEEKALQWIEERVPRDREPSLCKTTLRAAAAYFLLHDGRRPAKEYPLRGVMLDWVDLRRVNLDGTDLTRADLNGSDLRRASLRGVNLRDAVLVSIDFSDADLSEADLRGCDCRRASFKGADLSGTRGVSREV